MVVTRVNLFASLFAPERANSAARLTRVEEKRDIIAVSEEAKKLSSDLRLRRTALTALESIPDTRSERVAELKRQFDAGTYDVSASDIADRIVERFYG